MDLRWTALYVERSTPIVILVLLEATVVIMI